MITQLSFQPYRVFAVVAILASALTGCFSSPAVKKQRFFNQGEQAFQQQLFPEAIISYSRALEIDPKFAEAHFRLAQCFEKQGNWPSAIQELQRAIAFQPTNWAAQTDFSEAGDLAVFVDDAQLDALVRAQVAEVSALPDGAAPPPPSAHPTSPLERALFEVGAHLTHRQATRGNRVEVLADGGFGVDVVTGHTSHLVGVITGLYDNTLVQISGSGIAAGTRVEVPSS